MKVKECHQKDPEKLELVSPESSIEEVYNMMMKDHATRVVYVVDENKKLLGLIHIGALIRLFGAKYCSDLLPQFSTLMAQKAKDIMSAPVSVNEEDNFSSSMVLMLETHIYDIPVLNHENKVIGRFNCFELLDALRSEENPA